MRFCFFLILLLAALPGLGQVDTIYTATDAIPCTLREIAYDKVLYSLQGEELVQSIPKNNVRRIRLRSGRMAPLAPPPDLKTIRSARDIDKVVVTENLFDAENLARLSSIRLPRTRAGSISEYAKTREYSRNRLRAQAAMLGGSLVLVRDSLQAVNVAQRQDNSGFETRFIGEVYASHSLDTALFRQRLAGRSELKAQEWFLLKEGDTKPVAHDFRLPFQINKVVVENGNMVLIGEVRLIGTGRFRVVYFDDQSLTLMYRRGDSVGNLILSF